jgi:EVE domain
MAYWIFKYNPEKYRLDDRLADPNPEITWTVSRHRREIAPGDTIFIWQTGRDRGIRVSARPYQGGSAGPPAPRRGPRPS